MLAWRLGDGLSQVAAADRLSDYADDARERIGNAATKGICVARESDDNLRTIRSRVWADSAPALLLTWGFFNATGFMSGHRPSKGAILRDPSWLPDAVAMAAHIAGPVAALQPNTPLILPRLRPLR
jgi:hypothetical protein